MQTEVINRTTKVAETGERTRSRPRQRRRWRITPYLFLLPGVFLVVVWVYYPFLQIFWLSLFHGNLAGGITRFVGLQNYRAMFQLPEFWQAVRNTVVYIVGISICAIGVPLFLALLLARIHPLMQRIYQGILFLPALLAPIVVSLIWLWLLNPVQGVFSQWILHLFGWNIPDLLNDPATAIWTMIGITSWQMFGISLSLIFAVIIGINHHYLEAARIDGASEWQILRFIIFPLLTPLLSFLLLYTVLFAGQWAFGPINVLTQGGPGNTTTNIYYLLYQFGFTFFNTGEASALAVLIFLILGTGAVIEVYTLDRRVRYES